MGSSSVHVGVEGNDDAPQEQVRPAHGWTELLKQIILVGCAVLLYFAVRGQTEGAESAALENGRRILDWERRLNIDIERTLQSWNAKWRSTTTLSNWVYIWLHWPVITATLIWLHRNRRYQYLLLRNAMFISGAIGLAIFIRFPVAPPRMLPGFVDTVAELSTSYRILQPPALVNKFAAMPSLHVGWNLLIGVALFNASRSRVVRLFAVAGPVLMTYAVVVTANHYVVDAIVGASVALVGLIIARMITLPIALSDPHLPRRHQPEVIEDDSGDTTVRQRLDGGSVIDTPGENQASP